MSKIDGENCLFKETIKRLDKQYRPMIIITHNYVVIKSKQNGAKDNVIILSKNTPR